MNYRSEIDGLRAFAVIGVVLYHIKFSFYHIDFFKGGFLGVDIFFVISGYLIGGLLLTELNNRGSINMLYFYERRARRILPVLFLVIFVFFIVASFSLFPTDFLDYSKSVISSLFMGSNFFFYSRSIEYGAPDSLLFPLLHTWSLSIEEQFYLIAPLFAIIIFNYFRKYLLTIVIAFILLSFQFAMSVSMFDDKLNFYFPFSRIWELLIGVSLAYSKIYHPKTENKLLKKVFPIFGFYLILHSFVFFNFSSSFPGILTIIPIIGTCLIIIFSSKNDLVGIILGSKTISSIGLISFSIYLWHFPIFLFSGYYFPEPTMTIKLFLIFLTFLISFISFKYIETPFRSKNLINTKNFLSIITFTFIFLIITALTIIRFEGFENRPFYKKYQDYFVNYEYDLGKLKNDRKEFFKLNKKYNPEKNEKPVLLIVGNSHAKDLFISLLHSKKFSNKFEIIISPDIQLACFDNSDLKLSNIASSFYSSEAYAKSDIIFISSRYYFENKCKRRNLILPIKSDFKGMDALIKQSKTDNKKIVLFGNIPEFPSSGGFPSLTDKIMHSIKEGEKDKLVKSPIRFLKDKFDKEFFNNLNTNRTNKINKKVKKIADLNKINYFDFKDIFCNSAEKVCYSFNTEGKRIYIDYGHRSLSGSRFFAKIIDNSNLIYLTDEISE